MKFTDIEFGDIEALARIDLEPVQRDRLRIQLARIIGFVEKLREIEDGIPEELETTVAAPLAHDEPEACLDREEVLGQAPDREGAFFRIPPVMDIESGGAGS